MPKTLLEEAEETAQFMLARLRGLAANESFTEAQRKDAKILHVTLTGAASIIQTQKSAHAFQMMLARQITNDPIELQRYIRVTMPEAAITKALPPPVKT